MNIFECPNGEYMATSPSDIAGYGPTPEAAMLDLAEHLGLSGVDIEVEMI